MFKVIFKTTYKVKEGRVWVQKHSTFEEIVKSEADAKLRAMALNWQIVQIVKLNA